MSLILCTSRNPYLSPIFTAVVNNEVSYNKKKNITSSKYKAPARLTAMVSSEITVKSRLKRCFARSSNISWPTYLLVLVFGLGSWIAVNGLWVELPVIVKHAPEKWNLPSYLTVIIQLANIGPVVYAVGNHFASKAVHEKSATIFVVSLGALACVLLAFYWDKTSYIGGVEHSTALLTLSFCLAIVDCTSSVVFLTFMAFFPSRYLTALFLGETFSGLLPAFVALGQGINDVSKRHANSSNGTVIDDKSASGMRFGPKDFFCFLFAMMVLCLLAFLGLNYLPMAKKQHVRPISQIPSQENFVDDTKPLLPNSQRDSSSRTERVLEDLHIIGNATLRQQQIIYLLCIQAWINCLSNGVLPSIQTYASEPYGEKTYHLGSINIVLRTFSHTVD